jgi:hypothetical protein
LPPPTVRRVAFDGMDLAGAAHEQSPDLSIVTISSRMRSPAETRPDERCLSLRGACPRVSPIKPQRAY